MAKVLVGNHSAVVVPRQDQERTRAFYCDVLGFKAIRKTDNKDDFQLGGDDYFHLSVLYGDCPDEIGPVRCKFAGRLQVSETATWSLPTARSEKAQRADRRYFLLTAGIWRGIQEEPDG